MTSNDQYALNWSNHTNHIRKAFDSLLSGSEFVDVTLSCEGKKISAHKMLLSACSTYFHDLFRDNPCQHPIVILRDVKFQNLIDILKFVYSGEVSVATENFNDFLKTAELLQISGLTEEETRNQLPNSNQKAEMVHSYIRQETEKQIQLKESTVKQKETTRKRIGSEVNNKEPDVVQKKLKEIETNSNANIKQEIEAYMEDDSLLQTQDPLDFEDPNEATEGIDVLQPEASQKCVDVQDLLNNEDGPLSTDNEPLDPLQCRVCNKKFSHPLSLKQHFPVHMGTTQCWICGAVLSRKYHLKLHMKTRHQNVS